MDSASCNKIIGVEKKPRKMQVRRIGNLCKTKNHNNHSKNSFFQKRTSRKKALKQFFSLPQSLRSS